jgi:hypothetical protein
MNVPLSDLNLKETWKLVVQNELGVTLASQPVAVDSTKGVIAFVRLVLQSPPAQAEPATQPVPPVVSKQGAGKISKTVKRTVKEKEKDKLVPAPEPENKE